MQWNVKGPYDGEVVGSSGETQVPPGGRGGGPTGSGRGGRGRDGGQAGVLLVVGRL